MSLFVSAPTGGPTFLSDSLTIWSGRRQQDSSPIQLW